MTSTDDVKVDLSRVSKAVRDGFEKAKQRILDGEEKAQGADIGW
jgi:hypothetical protein